MQAKSRYPNRVVASLVVSRKEKPNGAVTARVLFDFTHGLAVTTRTMDIDQDSVPSNLKRAMRAKADEDENTVALTADVSEAHRQILIHPSDGHLSGCQVKEGADVHINTVGTLGVTSAC